jgi:hypothetical protein
MFMPPSSFGLGVVNDPSSSCNPRKRGCGLPCVAEHAG